MHRVDLLAAEGGVADEEPLPPLPPPPPLEVGGAVGPSDAADFVTGSVVLNRMHRAVNQVPLPLPAYPYPTPSLTPTRIPTPTLLTLPLILTLTPTPNPYLTATATATPNRDP